MPKYRFTAVIEDNDTNEFHVLICSAPSADDVEMLAKQWLFEKDVETGNIDGKEYTEDLSVVDINVVAVFSGDHPNLVSNDTTFHNVPESWTFDEMKYLALQEEGEEPDDESDDDSDDE